MGQKSQFVARERGVSEVVAAVLLIGIVLLGASLTVVFGSSAVEDINDRNNLQTARLVFQEFDSKMDTLSEKSDVTSEEFDVGEPTKDTVVERRGRLNVTVNRNGTCSTAMNLSSIRYHNDHNQLVGYELGGVWERTTDNGSTTVTPPDVKYRDGSIQIDVVNLTGTIQESSNTAVLDVGSSETQSRDRTNALLQGACVRPDNVTISIQSDFYRAWGSYFREGFNGTVKVFDDNSTAQVYVPQSELPRQADDERNNVVNLADTDYMDDVSVTASSISIDKGTSNTYSVGVRPLNRDHLEVVQVQELNATVEQRRDPLDVLFILDESGSMGADDADASGTTRIEAAREAAKGFHPLMNDSFDRTGLVSFQSSPEARYHPTREGLYMSRNYDHVNESIDDLNDGGGTHINAGIRYANDIFGLKSNETRNRVAILLTDGRNNPPTLNSNTIDRAHDAADAGITIHAVGFGEKSEVNEGLLKDVASITGGQYNFSENADELDAFFKEIAREETTTEQIAHVPMTTNFPSSNPHPPGMVGDTDDMATITTPSGEFLNVNDPMAPSQFAHRFRVTGGEDVTLEASWYDCESDGWEVTPYAESENGTVYPRSRCVDVDESAEHQISDANTNVFIDGDDVSHLMNDDAGWWQENMSQKLDPYTDASDHLDLKSNQALVVFDYPDFGMDADNRLLVIYEIGRAEEDARPEDILNIRVRNIGVNEGST
jgi:Mg-chelatase subunit ChlD